MFKINLKSLSVTVSTTGLTQIQISKIFKMLCHKGKHKPGYTLFNLVANSSVDFVADVTEEINFKFVFD